jgi:hypothetical protein
VVAEVSAPPSNIIVLPSRRLGKTDRNVRPADLSPEQVALLAALLDPKETR